MSWSKDYSFFPSSSSFISFIGPASPPGNPLLIEARVLRCVKKLGVMRKRRGGSLELSTRGRSLSRATASSARSCSLLASFLRAKLCELLLVATTSFWFLLAWFFPRFFQLCFVISNPSSNPSSNPCFACRRR